MSVFIMEYRVIGYNSSHALSLNPKAGKRVFFANSEDIGTSDILVVTGAAKSKENTPDGYRLFSVIDRDAAISSPENP